MSTPIGQIAFNVVATTGELERTLARDVGAAANRAAERAKFAPKVDEAALGTLRNRLTGIVGPGSAAANTLGQIGGAAGALGPRMAALASPVGAAAAAFGALTAVVGLGVSELAAAQVEMAQTDALIKATGGSANITAAEVRALAESIEELSGADAENVQRAENLLLTFRAIRNEVGEGNDIFNQAVLALADFGQVFTRGDVAAGAVQLGKALNDPVQGITALRRVGVSFTDAQRNLIEALVESGDILSAQKIILQELRLETEGAAEAYGNTLPGAMDRLKAKGRDFSEGFARPVFEGLDTIAQKAADTGVDFESLGEGIGSTLFAPLQVLADAFGLVTGAQDETTESTEELFAGDIRAAEASNELNLSMEARLKLLEPVNDATEDLTDAQERLRDADTDLADAEEDLAEATEEHRRVLRGYPADSEEARKATQEATQADRAARDARIGLTNAENDSTQAREELTLAQQHLNDVLHGYAASSKEAKDALEELDDAQRSLQRSQLGIEEAADAVEDAERELIRTRQLAVRAERAFGEQSPRTVQAREAVEDAERKLRSARLGLSDAQDQAQGSEEDLAEAQRIAAGVTSGFAEGTDEAKRAREELTAAEERATAAAQAELRARESLTDATEEQSAKQRDLNNVLHGYAADSDEAKAASEKLEGAHRAVEKAERDREKSLSAVAEKTREATAEQKKYNEALAAAGVDPRDEFGQLVVGTIQSFQGGGTVPGPRGAPRIILAHGGEEVIDPSSGFGSRGAEALAPVEAVIVLPDMTVLARAILPGVRAVQQSRG